MNGYTFYRYRQNAHWWELYLHSRQRPQALPENARGAMTGGVSFEIGYLSASRPA